MKTLFGMLLASGLGLALAISPVSAETETGGQERYRWRLGVKNTCAISVGRTSRSIHRQRLTSYTEFR